jgi:signal transduction histidine kinase
MQVVEELELAHPDWTIRLDVRGDQRGLWDADRMLQVFSNLVANAGQHGTLEGGITIALDGTAQHEIRIDVRNEGAIPESLLPHLFEPFRMTPRHRSQSSGLGLGLFIVREIVRAHGGTVEVTSTEATGTTFRLRLPRAST